MTQPSGLVIVGAGGHAKVVFCTALACSEKIAGFVDDNPVLFNASLQGYPVLGNTAYLLSPSFEFEAAVLALGSNAIRQRIAEQAGRMHWKTLVHPTAYVHPSVQLGVGTVVFAGAVIQPDAKIGNHCIINTGTTIDHDCVIEDYVHLAPGVHLAGNVNIGQGTFLGIGSVVIPGMTIGSWVTVAAGGVVISPVSASKTVMGIPARERI